MEKSNDIIGNRTRDLPACSAVPQPTVPPRAPKNTYMTNVIFKRRVKMLNDAMFMGIELCLCSVHRVWTPLICNATP